MSLEALKKNALQNPEVLKEYDALEGEFTLINDLLKMRLDAGLTQKDVADRMGTRKSNVCRLEKGGTSPKVDTLRRYASACGHTLTVAFAPEKAVG